MDSGSRFETLAAVKKHIDWYLKARGNPAKFDRCVKAVKAKGGAYDPYAVCTAAGTRNPSSLYPDGSFVKAQFQQRGYSELLWVKVDRANDATRKISGTVDNQPVFLRKIKLGSKVKLRYNEVIDRMNPARRKRATLLLLLLKPSQSFMATSPTNW